MLYINSFISVSSKECARLFLVQRFIFDIADLHLVQDQRDRDHALVPCCAQGASKVPTKLVTLIHPRQSQLVSLIIFIICSFSQLSPNTIQHNCC